MIFPVWQPLFSSSHRLAAQWSEELGEPVTHTGTLDPIAQGVLVLLTGEDRFAKGEFSDWNKTYEFSVLWGVQTDSGDQMGLITRLGPTLSSAEDLKSTLASFPVEYEQRIPDFSARRWNGASGFDAAKHQQEIEPKTRLVRIDGLALLGSEVLSREQIKSTQHSIVSAVTGDFRQADILGQWQQTEFIGDTFLITHHVVQTSPGTYIRQLVQDFAEQVGVCATTWAITRTQNGPYEKLDT